MSKKDRLNKQKKETNKNTKPEETEIKSKGEKIFTYVTIAVGIIAFLVIILLSIPYGGDKERIARRYDSLTQDNVYQYIEFDEYREKIQNGDEFHILFINTKLENALDFIYYADQVAKDNNIEVVYLFDTGKIDDHPDQERYLKRNIESNVLDSPNLVYYRQTIESYSVDYAATCRYNVGDYGGNYWKLIVGYFDYCTIVEE